jgi:hypothetical protein
LASSRKPNSLGAEGIIPNIEDGTLVRAVSPIPGPVGPGAEAKKKDISVDEGKSIVAEAATWKGTPYMLNGPGAIKGLGGDCSGTTQEIYQAAQCPYTYRQAKEFPEYALKSGLFRELGASDQKQEGDILSWSSHMAIYSSFASDPTNATTERLRKDGKGTWTQRNDMWTASHLGTASRPSNPYAPAERRYWRPDAPRVFRYQK